MAHDKSSGNRKTVMYGVVVPTVELFHNSVHRCIDIRASSYVCYGRRGPPPPPTPRTFFLIYLLNLSNHYLYSSCHLHPRASHPRDPETLPSAAMPPHPPDPAPATWPWLARNHNSARALDRTPWCSDLQTTSAPPSAAPRS